MPDTYSQLGKEVPVASIDKELKLLWEADDATTNASLMNLVIYSETPGSLLTNYDAAVTLTRENACRAILVEIDRGHEDASTQAWITAHCQMVNGRKSVCCEQVALRLLGRAHGRLSNTVFAHLASDLPLIFWWQGEFSDVFNPRLTTGIDRLLIDSSDFADPAASYTALVAAMEEANHSFIVQDLAWTRTYQFRLTFAKLFDEAIAQASLSTIQSVDIQTHPDHFICGQLMLAWMAVQAGWTIESCNGKAYSAKTAEGELVNILFTTEESSAPLGRVALAGPDFSLILDRPAGDTLIHETLSCGQHCVEGVTPADADTSAGLVASQLSRGGRNRLYRKTLPVLRQMLTL